MQTTEHVFIQSVSCKLQLKFVLCVCVYVPDVLVDLSLTGGRAVTLVPMYRHCCW